MAPKHHPTPLSGGDRKALSKELGKRTIYNLLSKPVARWQFLVGKFLGMFATLALMMAFLNTYVKYREGVRE